MIVNYIVTFYLTMSFNFYSALNLTHKTIYFTSIISQINTTLKQKMITYNVKENLSIQINNILLIEKNKNSKESICMILNILK